MKKALALFAFLVPLLSFAQTLEDGLGTVGRIISKLVPILIGIALLTFIWGVIKYIISKDAESQSEAKGFIIWGIIGLFVIVSVWGIIGLLRGTFIPGNDQIDPVEVPGKFW